MIMGSARTVSARLPPPSCSSTMLPQRRFSGRHGGKCDSTYGVICSAERRGLSLQSLGSMRFPTVMYPISCGISSGRT